MEPKRITSIATWGLLIAAAGVSFALPGSLPITMADVPTPPNSIRLTGTLRDFQASHSDFGVVPDGGYGHYAGNVSATLDANGQPVFTGLAAAATPLSNFAVSQHTITPAEDFVLEVAVLGAAIYTGVYHEPVTAQLTVGGTTIDPFGPFTQPVDANVNDDQNVTGNVNPGVNPRKVVLPGTHNAGTAVSVTGRSWQKKNDSASEGLNNAHWEEHYTAEGPSGSARLKTLKAGDPVPNIDGVYDQPSVGRYVSAFIDTSTNTMALAPNQVIYLFELGTDPSSSSADFQDLVLLVSLAADASYFATRDSLQGSDGTSGTLTAGYKVTTEWFDSAGRPIPPHLATSSDTAGAKGATDMGGITSEETYAQWYRDSMGDNLSLGHSITLVEDVNGVYEYSTNDFRPADGRLFGNEGQAHNCYFTYEIATRFTYDAGGAYFFEFEGADDAWLYVDGQLAMDLGGVGSGTSQYVDFDRLGLTDGQTYTMNFFYAQRQCSYAGFHMRTNIALATQQLVTVSGGFD